MIEIEVAVDLSKFRDSHPLISEDYYEFKRSKKDFTKAKMTAQFEVSLSQKSDLVGRLKLMLLRSNENIFITLEDTTLKSQLDHLLYIASRLNKLDYGDYTQSKIRFQYHEQIYLIRLAETLIKKDDLLQIRIIRPDGNNLTVKIPKVQDVSSLYHKEAYFNHEFHLIKDTSLDGLTEAFKSSNKYMPEEKNDVNLRMAYISTEVLQYLQTLPQFRSSKRKHSTFSEPQGRFLMDYCYVFGLYNNDNRIRLTQNIIDYKLFSDNLRYNIKKVRKNPLKYCMTFS